MRKLIESLIKTDENLALFICRVTVGAVILPHGLQKLLGIFGGHGLAATIEAFSGWFALPAALTVLVILAESFGALLLILGLLGRFQAAAIGAVMIGAIVLVTGRWGFFMNWYSEQRGEGFEFHLLVLGMVIALLFGGSGRWSLDRLLYRRLNQTAPHR